MSDLFWVQFAKFNPDFIKTPDLFKQGVENVAPGKVLINDTL